jgi:UDPglucose 6-dehydrogenase/GDP-mannose 6-dehydrogenase
MRLAVVGTGYVGLVSGVCLASVGHKVICVDVSPERVAAISRSEVPFYEPGLGELLSKVLANGSLRATIDLREAVISSEVSLIAVGTPFVGDSIDLSYVTTATEQIGLALRHTPGYHVVAIKSTVLPGTTDTLVRGILEQTSGIRVGGFGLCVNPEFLRESSAVNDFMQPDRIVIGQWDEESGRVLAEVYKSFDCPLFFTSLRDAELIKNVSNAFLATMISFCNEIAALCEVTPGTDVEVVMKGLHLDHRLSPIVDRQRIIPGILSYLRAGCGFGGSCLPKDVNALRTYARERGKLPHLLDAVMAVNAERPAQLVDLAEKIVGSLCGSTVAVLGLAFKPGTDDVRNSPALDIIDRLLNKSAIVRAYDPLITKTACAVIDERVTLCETPEATLTGVDAALLVTAWPEFANWDWAFLSEKMRHRVIIDGRNALREVPLPDGVTYASVGRALKRDHMA